MNLADEAAAEVFVESLSLTLRRLKHMASTVETGRSKEGYQTRDAGVLRYATRCEVAPRADGAERGNERRAMLSRARRLASLHLGARNAPDYIISSPPSLAGYQQ